ncbi:uncharacterized protein LOC120422011 isoform X1 [Culex pipiens pallens]|uniref:uncharacterized protein LOC120422011 isoform X1 n=1 Tax=Culex pipiens pallens TaxID=42434 RepID=UPI00195310B2|nr:uncharacterized protein LOC120422011 isoform X1 [Culex pipiens pallens]
MPFKYDIPLADRFGQLVNNEFAADVFFEVGSSQRLMYGHRSILSVGSPVFNAQLNGDFVEARNNSRQHPIVVTDVEEDVFLQILRYIYSANATVNHRNAVELYYASQKYLLIDLRCICENFFNSSLWKENVVTVFNANRKHEFPIVNDCCLEIICDNPLRFLSGENLTSLLEKSLEMIVGSVKINCSEDHLLDAVSEWGKFHKTKSTYQLRHLILSQKQRSLKCKKLLNFDGYCTINNPDICLNIKTDRKIAIYGFGVYVGSPDLEGYEVEISVNAQVINQMLYRPFSSYLTKTENQRHTSLTKSVIKDELYIQEIIFEKLTVSSEEQCLIIGFMKVNAFPTAPMFCLRQFKPYNLPKGVNLTVKDITCNYYSCVAYVLYNVL